MLQNGCDGSRCEVEIVNVWSAPTTCMYICRMSNATMRLVRSSWEAEMVMTMSWSAAACVRAVWLWSRDHETLITTSYLSSITHKHILSNHCHTFLPTDRHSHLPCFFIKVQRSVRHSRAYHICCLTGVGATIYGHKKSPQQRCMEY